MKIIPATTEQDLAEIKALFLDYTNWLGLDLSYQGFEEELASLPGQYTPPYGALYLAKNDSEKAIGCIAMRSLDSQGTAELKRLYIRPEGRGLGLGHKLVSTIIEAARTAGYQRIRLDTLPSMTSALAIYRTAGFQKIPRYYETPHAETVFMECVL